MTASSHLAGIIPVAGLKTDYDIETPEYLLPVDPGFTAIQKAVYECALAGCQTIWIVANGDTAPIIRTIIGEWIYDPVYFSNPHIRFSSEHRREIPIYYTPIHPKDRDRRDSYGWSILHGINSAWRTATRISKWVVPDKYYVSFPMNAHNVYNIRRQRLKISDTTKNWFMTHEGKTVKDNIPLPFTMFGQDYIHCRRHVNKQTTRQFLNPPPGEIPTEKLPLHERWSARHFDFDEIFDAVDETEAHTEKADWFYDITSWEGYKSFLGSENFIKKPINNLIKPHSHVRLPYREGEIDDD